MKEQHINQADIAALRAVIPPRKSVMNFSAADVAATGAFERKFHREIGAKSPYQRRMADWRAAEETPVPVLTVEDQRKSVKAARKDAQSGAIRRGTVVNNDTGYEINMNRAGILDTIAYASRRDARGVDMNASISVLYHLDNVIKNAVLLDTMTSEGGKNKAQNTLLMHLFYAPFNMGNKQYLAKVTAEEFFQESGDGVSTSKRFYNVRDIKISPIDPTGFGDQMIAPKRLPGTLRRRSNRKNRNPKKGWRRNMFTIEEITFIKSISEDSSPERVWLIEAVEYMAGSVDKPHEKAFLSDLLDKLNCCTPDEIAQLDFSDALDAETA